MAEDKEERFTTGSWAGIPNYRCTHCAFETVDRAAMEEHANQSHTLENALKQAQAAAAASSPRGSGQEADK